ncbi:DUF397 domain-containing protein [Actinoallomurus sp. NPDC052308]
MSNTHELIDPAWRKSSHSGQSGQCVEVAVGGEDRIR